MKLSRFIASGFFSGFSPISPGTIGTAIYVILWLALTLTFPGWSTITLQILLLFFLTLTGLYVSRVCLQGERLSPQYSKGEKEDPQYIVIDEWAGMQVALLLASPQQPLAIICAFALFRFFDILKPGPVRRAEKLPGEWGIMLDDIIAGLLSLGIWVIVSALLPI